MLKSAWACGFVVCFLASQSSCAGAPPAKSPSPGAASASPSPRAAVSAASVPSEPPAEPPKGPEDSPGFADAVALLRPAAAQSALQRLAAAPTEARAYAQAALAYASTDAPGMTMLWGMTYQAMGGGASDAEVATAFSKVLTDRILARPDEHGRQVSFNLRLAPGQMPLRQQPNGSVHAPIAHVFEALFGPAVTGFRPPWTIEQFYDVSSNWAGLIASHGTALDERVELNGWLVTLAKAGHLEAFCYRLLGPAFPAELKAYAAKNAAELRAYQDYLKATPLRPTQAYMPDDLVRIK